MLLVLFAVFIDLVGFGLIFPLLPFLTEQYGGSTLAGAGLISIYSLMAFLSGPFWGRLSDRIGRKPALVMTFLGGSISYATFAFAGSMEELFIARAMSGAMAGNVGIVMATMADLTDEKTRGRAMGWIGAAFALGFSFGPGLGALLAEVTGETSTLVPGLVASALSLSAATMTALFMPETNPNRRKSQAELEEPIQRSIKAGSIVKSTPASVQRYGKPPSWRMLIDNPRFNLLLLMIWVTALGQSTNFTMTPYWLTTVHDWQIQHVGAMMMMIGLIVAVIQSVLLGPFFRIAGELGATTIGAAVFLAASLTLWLAQGSEALTVVVFLFMVSGLTVTFPAMNAILSIRTDARVQGSVLGLANGIAALGRVVGPLAGGLLFTDINPTLPFLMVTTVGVVVIVWSRWEARKPRPEPAGETLAEEIAPGSGDDDSATDSASAPQKR